MRWVSFSGELAFLSIGGTAKGVIAIGGIFAAGVVAIGMNAVGTVAAVGMNAAAPLSVSLINGAGIYCVAGVNGLGVWTVSGVNAAGLIPEGDEHAAPSLWPALGVTIVLFVASLVLRGDRIVRKDSALLPLRDFLRAADPAAAKVRAELVDVESEHLVLAGGGESERFAVDPSLAASARMMPRPGPVDAYVSRTEEAIHDADDAGYRDRPGALTRVVLRCSSIERAPGLARFLPRTDAELLWVIAWTARVSVLAALGALVWLTF